MRRDYAMTARALVRAPIVELLVRTTPLPSVCARLGIALVTDSSDVSAIVSPVGKREWAAARRVFRRTPLADTCLRRSLLVGWLLRSAHPSLRIGVGRDGAPSFAHAWLEIDGQPVGEFPTDFAPLHRRRA